MQQGAVAPREPSPYLISEMMARRLIMWIFSTRNRYSLTLSKQEQFKLFHGHRTYDQLSPQLLMDRAKDAGSYLAQIVKDTGRQVYRYNPRSDYEPFGYNFSRHAGSLYAMARIFRWWQDSYLKQSMKLTLDYLKQSIQDCPLPLSPNVKAKCSVDFETKDKVKMSKLGVNALTILAIVEYVDAVKPDDATELLTLASQIAVFVKGSMRTGVKMSEAWSRRFIFRMPMPCWTLIMSFATDTTRGKPLLPLRE
jgi:hypothetical protein